MRCDGPEVRILEGVIARVYGVNMALDIKNEEARGDLVRALVREFNRELSDRDRADMRRDLAELYDADGLPR